MREVDPNEQLDEDVEEVGSNPWKGLQKELIWDLSQISGPLSKEGALVHLTPVFPCSLQPSLFFCLQRILLFNKVSVYRNYFLTL